MKAIRVLKNKYLIASVFFVTWMLFFDHNNIFSHLEYRTELNELKRDKKYYQEQIEETRKEVEMIKRNPQALEKVAREMYLMKRDDEDVFVVGEEVMSDK
jgi:cell division protein DivIC